MKRTPNIPTKTRTRTKTTTGAMPAPIEATAPMPIRPQTIEPIPPSEQPQDTTTEPGEIPDAERLPHAEPIVPDIDLDNLAESQVMPGTITVMQPITLTPYDPSQHTPDEITAGQIQLMSVIQMRSYIEKNGLTGPGIEDVFNRFQLQKGLIALLGL